LVATAFSCKFRVDAVETWSEEGKDIEDPIYPAAELLPTSERESDRLRRTPFLQLRVKTFPGDVRQRKGKVVGVDYYSDDWKGGTTELLLPFVWDLDFIPQSK